MMTEPDPYRDWDAAYLLGALSQIERREYESHLADCAVCREAVDELAGLPGLLSRVSADDALMLQDQDKDNDNDAARRRSDAAEPVSDLMPRLRVASRRIRRRRRAWTAGIAAAVVALALVLPPAIGSLAPPHGTSYAMSPVASRALSAKVVLVSESWGTRVDADCRYAPGATAGRYSASATYAMYITGKNGTATRVSSWQSRPGETVDATGTTSLAVADIASVDIRSVPDGRVMLRTDVGRQQ